LTPWAAGVASHELLAASAMGALSSRERLAGVKRSKPLIKSAMTNTDRSTICMPWFLFSVVRYGRTVEIASSPRFSP
jgi:hypothetical protein